MGVICVGEAIQHCNFREEVVVELLRCEAGGAEFFESEEISRGDLRGGIRLRFAVDLRVIILSWGCCESGGR